MKIIMIMNIMHLNVTMHHTYHSPLEKHRCKLVKLTEMVVAVTQNFSKHHMQLDCDNTLPEQV